jgi:hypothetical protein
MYTIYNIIKNRLNVKTKKRPSIFAGLEKEMLCFLFEHYHSYFFDVRTFNFANWNRFQ